MPARRLHSACHTQGSCPPSPAPPLHCRPASRTTGLPCFPPTSTGPRQRGLVRAGARLPHRRSPLPRDVILSRALQVGLCARGRVCGPVGKGPLCPPPQAAAAGSLTLVMFGGDALLSGWSIWVGRSELSLAAGLSATSGSRPQQSPSSPPSWALVGIVARASGVPRLPPVSPRPPGLCGGLDLGSVPEPLLI